MEISFIDSDLSDDLYYNHGHLLSQLPVFPVFRWACRKGMFTELLSEDDRLQRTFDNAFWAWSEQAYAYGRTGQQVQARHALAKTLGWSRVILSMRKRWLCHTSA